MLELRLSPRLLRVGQAPHAYVDNLVNFRSDTSIPTSALVEKGPAKTRITMRGLAAGSADERCT